jgi:hypothetical protein
VATGEITSKTSDHDVTRLGGPRITNQTSLETDLQNHPFGPLQHGKDHSAPVLDQSPTNFTTGLLRVDNLLANQLTVKSISKLCGCFGNVINISYIAGHPRMFVRFQKPTHCEVAFKFLDGLRLFDVHLKLFVLNGSEIEMAFEDIDGASYSIYLEKSSLHRFRDNLTIKMNPVTAVLHFTNLSKSLEPFVIFLLISQIREPIKIVRQSHVKSRGYMYLAFFLCREDAAQVLSIMHNKIIDGKIIKVSFSNRS